MAFSPLLKQMIDALSILPGVGPKSAQRMAFHLLKRDKEGGQHLARVLHQAIEQIGHCQQCYNFSEKPVCTLCENKNRDKSLLCIVQGPAHVVAIEQTGGYYGLYFVLSGQLSPIDGVGPEDIGMQALTERLNQGVVKEIILATNSTVEGEATAFYIAEIAKRQGIYVSRIAHGVPLGGDLEYIDGGTIAKALALRSQI